MNDIHKQTYSATGGNADAPSTLPQPDIEAYDRGFMDGQRYARAVVEAARTYFLMTQQGGPDGSELDAAVELDMRDALAALDR